MDLTVAIIAIVASLVVGLGIGVFIGWLTRKKSAEKKIGSAEAESKRIKDDATHTAETMKKEALLEAKEDILRQKNEADRDIKERRAEVSRSERRLAQREENLDSKEKTLDSKEKSLDKKSETLDRKNEQLDQKNAELDKIKVQLDEVLESHIAKLEEISSYTVEQAKDELMNRVEAELQSEIAHKLDEYETQYKEEAEAKAKNILSLAIQRCAADHVAEATISVVTLPSEEMKGRIIGREGRNIQKLETLTGVELIIDDTPEAITLSGFDPVKREVARLALERLIADGRIHPARIEEMVEKAKKEVDTLVKQAGERVATQANVQGINPELIRILGRLRYRISYGQNVLQHSLEVSLLAGIMADELGVDSTLARRAGLLHDIGKAAPHNVEGSHVEIGVMLAKRYKESREVIHAIEAHHNDVEPQTIIAILVQAADAISAARPGARREDMENYIKRLEKLEEIAESFDGIEKAYAIQAGRELRVMVKPEAVTDEGMVLIAHEMALKIQNEVRYPGQIKINVIRESRATDYAK